LMQAQGLSCSHSGEHWVSVHCGKPASWHLLVADHHSVEKLGFQFLDRRDRTLLQGGTE
jgi:hypothetical protein